MRKATRTMNGKYELTKNSEKMLRKSTISNYIAKGLIGVSPLKQGPARKMPSEFNKLFNARVEMKQLEGVQESKPKHIKALIGVAVRET